MSSKIAIDRQRIADLCRRRYIRRLALFGSVLRDDFGPESDVDVLVEFEPGHVPGFGFVDIQDELSELFGRTVDLHTPGSLSRYFRDHVCAKRRTSMSGGSDRVRLLHMLDASRQACASSRAADAKSSTANCS